MEQNSHNLVVIVAKFAERLGLSNMLVTWPALLAGDVYLLEMDGGDFVSLLQPRVPQIPFPLLTPCPLRVRQSLHRHW